MSKSNLLGYEGLRQLEGPELVQETVDKIQTVKQCLKQHRIDRRVMLINIAGRWNMRWGKKFFWGVTMEGNLEIR
ncbi:UNVERIFIED_CONTAM: hypothetical protein Slati_1307900 [Sesamum latifolium]|uniref:Uncharacterized protein n=1 Tax=Sesamum latifolium TaxID=2727402 RepID=A0AAW2XH62_9LAMI